MVSWVWTYCKKVDKEFYSCNICLKKLARSGGTKNMISHLTVTHKITKDTIRDEVPFLEQKTSSSSVESQQESTSEDEISRPERTHRRSSIKLGQRSEEDQQSDDDFENDMDDESDCDEKQVNLQEMSQKRSWSWAHYTPIDKKSASCNYCEKVLLYHKGTSPLIYHLKIFHSMSKTTEPQCQGSNDEVKMESKTQSSMGEIRSWSWTHYTPIGKKAASCNYCEKVISCKYGTKGMISHLEALHSINQMSQKRSWSWAHYTPIDKKSASCNYCEKVLLYHKGTSPLIYHLKICHSMSKTTEPLCQDSNEEVKMESRTQSSMGEIRSWSWTHYTPIGKNAANCNYCEKDISCKEGTAILISHLEEVHSIAKAAKPKSGSTPNSTRSWVWSYYTVIDKLSARCNICRKVHACNGGTSELMKHLQSQHDINESSVNTEGTRAECDENSWGVQENLIDNFIECPTISSFHKENCFVCNEKLTSCRTKLSFKTKLTSMPLYKILESFTGAELDQDTRIDSAVCHDCFVSFQQYDKWQHKSSELQRKMTQMCREIHSEQVFIKEEPIFDDDDEDYNKRKREADDDSDQDWWSEETNQKRQRLSKPETAQNQRVDPKPSIDEESFCVTCSKTFKNPTLFEIHLVTNHERSTGPFNCPKCYKSSNGLNSLKSHYLNHQEKALLPRSLLCNKCGATFLSRRSFELHMQKHDDIRPYPCTIPGCSKKFLHSFHLKFHLKEHSREKISECTGSPGRIFAEKWKMVRLIRTQHMNEPSQSGDNQECKICGIRFNSKSKLKSHLENVHEVAPETRTEKTAPVPETEDL